MEYPKIVTIGGGTGLSTVLSGLKHFPVDITAIVTVADDGGSSGILRSDLQVPPPGDIRNVLVALSDVEPVLEELMQFRFQNTDSYLSGHPVGNLLLAALYSISDGNFVDAVEKMARVLNVSGQVYPSAAKAMVLHAELEDGTIVEGESQLAKHKSPIKRVFFEDQQPAVPECMEAILEADVIVFGPGSLFTSVIPNILFPEIQQAILDSSAQKVYICNIMTEHGETDFYTVSDHIQKLNEHLGASFLDAVIANDEAIPKEYLKRYAQESAQPVILDCPTIEAMGIEIIPSRIADWDITYGVRHDAIKVAAAVYSRALEYL
ncbi:MAG: gluconeogenesis factor YvcK family protein [Culicoidibacterales bacterium]